MTDENKLLECSTPQDILIGASTAFIVQNKSNSFIKFKIKDSSAIGGVIPPLQTFSFASDVTVWNDSVFDDIELYIMRN